MDRTLYSKYSNERAKKFCIRTDIVLDDAGEKRVYKHALFPEARMHVVQIEQFYRKLTEAYREGNISFCPCEKVEDAVCFPFLKGITLQDILEQAVGCEDEETVQRILVEFIRRVRTTGGEQPFWWTEEFNTVFGALTQEEQELLRKAGSDASVSAKVSDIDLIFSNIFVDDTNAVCDAAWQVIDYEWTYDFPIPKGFLIYRAMYFAYYQILHGTKWTLETLFALADIGEDEACIYRKMEEHFQKYLGTGTLPVRNMQRAMGTQIISLEELLDGGMMGQNVSASGVQESEWLRVRKIQYHIDRKEYQDGSYVCSGWAFAMTWDGRYLPVDIQVLSHTGENLKAEITRGNRNDVAMALKIKRVTKPRWGFDLVWVEPAGESWKICFSLGKKVCICEA